MATMCAPSASRIHQLSTEDLAMVGSFDVLVVNIPLVHLLLVCKAQEKRCSDVLFAGPTITEAFVYGRMLVGMCSVATSTGKVAALTQFGCPKSA